MSSSLNWRADAHGTYNLAPEGASSFHAWILPRRPYCDRGHWEASSLGLPHRPGTGPAMYFMELDHAIEETEAWVIRRLDPEAPGTPCPDWGVREAFAPAIGQPEGWAWEAEGPQSWRTECEGLTLRLRWTEVGTPRRGQMVLEAEVDNLDDADLFPRVYADASIARQEAEAFARWRVLHLPTVIPGPITDAPRAVGEALDHFLSDVPAPAVRPRPRSGR